MDKHIPYFLGKVALGVHLSPYYMGGAKIPQGLPITLGNLPWGCQVQYDIAISCSPALVAPKFWNFWVCHRYVCVCVCVCMCMCNRRSNEIRVKYWLISWLSSLHRSYVEGTTEGIGHSTMLKLAVLGSYKDYSIPKNHVWGYSYTILGLVLLV